MTLAALRMQVRRALDLTSATAVHSLLTGPRSGDLAQELAAVWNGSALDYRYDIERAPSEPRNQKLLLQYKNGCLPPPLLWRKDPLLANEPEGLLPQSWPQHWYTYPRLVMLRTRARRLLLAADTAEHSPLLQAARQDAERDAAARRLAAARCATPSVAALRGTLAVCQECRGELSFDAAAAGPAPPVELRSSDCARCLRLDIDSMVAARWPDAARGGGGSSTSSAPHVSSTPSAPADYCAHARVVLWRQCTPGGGHGRAYCNIVLRALFGR